MRLKIFCSTLLLLMLNVAVVCAQITNNCDGTDPDLSCPLDTWVFFLAGVTIIFATARLYRKQKS